MRQPLKRSRERADVHIMVPPDGVRSKRLPTMSWESVVDDVTTSVDPAVDPPLPDPPLADPPLEDLPLEEASVDDAPLEAAAIVSLSTPLATTPLTQPAPISFSTEPAPTPSAGPLPMQSALADEAAMRDIASAIAKIQDNAGDLVK